MTNIPVSELIIRKSEIADLQELSKMSQFNQLIMNKLFDRDINQLENLQETAQMTFTVEHLERVVGFVAISDEPEQMNSTIPSVELKRSAEALHRLFQTNEDSQENDFWITFFQVQEGYSQQEVLYQVFDVVQRSNPVVNGFYYLTPSSQNQEYLAHTFGDSIDSLLMPVAMADDFGAQCTILDITVQSDLALFQNAKTAFQPLIEIRRAQQEDHDDLSVIFEANSKEIKETQGEFFLAELIKKCQDENNKALVAQYKDKVLGFIAISNEIDLSVLQKCFELEQFDFLLKPKFVELMRERKVEIEEQNGVKKEEERRAFEQKIENEKVLSHRIANTNHFQSQLQGFKEKFIKNDIEEYLKLNKEAEKKNSFEDRSAWANLRDEEREKKRQKEQLLQEKQFKKCKKDIERIINDLTKDFSHKRPSEFFREFPQQAQDVYGTLSKPDNYLIKILNNQGLARDYMESLNSHFVERMRGEMKEARLKAKREQSQSQDKDKAGKDLLLVEPQKPSYFDPEPLVTKFTTFINLTPLMRQKIREMILEYKSKIKNEVFTKEDEEKNITKSRVLNVYTLYEQLLKKNISLVLIDQKLNANSHESNLALVGLIKTFTDFKLRTHKFTIHPASKFWINSIQSQQEKTNQIPSQKSKFKKEVHTKSRYIQLTEDWVIATMVDIPEDEDLKEPDEPVSIDASDLQGGSGLFVCKEDEKAKPLEIEAEVIEQEDLIKIANQLEQQDTMLYKLGVIKDEVKTYDEICEERKRQAAAHDGEEQGDEEFQKQEQEAEPDRDEDEEGQVEETAIVEETEESRQVKSWNEYFQSVGDVEKDLRDIPDDASNAFCITLFFTHEDIDNLSQSFVEKAFEQFPDKEQMVITQPHRNKDNQLLRHFTLVDKKPSNTFSHCLQVIHRDQVFQNFIKIKEVWREHNDFLWERIKTELGHIIPEAMQELLEKVCTEPKKVTRKQRCLVPVLDEEIPLGIVLLTDSVNQGYYRSHFNIDSKVSNMALHKDSICKLEYLYINPIQERQRRYILRKVMSRTEKTMVCFEVDKSMKELPAYISEFEFLSKRTFPLFLNQWDHERDEMDKKELLTPNVAGAERDQLDLQVAEFNLFVLPKNRILDNKVRVNKRIIVVGNGDCGIAFTEHLLDHPNYKFTSVSIVAPGGVSGRNRDLFENLKISFTNYTDEEIDNLIIENRINVVNDQMVDLDRDNQIITLSTGFKMPQDELVLCFGIQDTSLQYIRPYSRNEDLKKAEDPIDEQAILEDWDGLISIDNPNIYNLIHKDSKLIAEVNQKKPRNVILQGNGLEIFTLVKGIFNRGVSYDRMYWLKNNKHQEQQLDAHADQDAVQPDQFAEDQLLQNQIVQQCKRLGINIEEGHALNQKPDFALLNKKIGAIRFEKKETKKADAKDDGRKKKMVDLKGKKDKVQTRATDTRDCRLCVSCGAKDIENRNFNFIHESGLVQDGRLIVDKNFKTTDPSIWAGGSHCEFSRRYRTQMSSRSLRMESYNSREVGVEVCKSFIRSLDEEQGENVERPSKPPQFSTPKMAGAIVLDGFYFFKVFAVNKEAPEEQSNFEKQRMFEPVVNNTLTEEGEGHQLNIVFDKAGKVRAVTYFSKRFIQVDSLKKMVGMHSSQLNMMIARQDAELVSNLPEFFNQTWANALWHDQFQAFRASLDSWLEQEADVGQIAEHLKAKLSETQSLSEEDFKTVWKMLSKDTKEKIKDETVSWLKKNRNQLPMYFLSREDFM